MTRTKDVDMDAAPEPRKPVLYWRFEFGSYGETRHFLDQLADLSKREEYYPNVSFGKTYVNVSIDAEGQVALGERQAAFIEEMKVCSMQDQA